MTDEPRRSGRATKGQYTKDRDVNEDGPAKKKGKGKGGKSKTAEADDEEQDEIIRCICGQYEEEEDVPRAMICCDNCSAWQHNDCMGLPESYAPEKYFCEQCRPEDHKEIVAALKRGERPWEEAARRREAAEAEKPNKKKGAKKARKSAGVASSEVASRASQEVDEGTPSTAAGQKRKHEEESPAPPEIKNSKKARATPTAEPNGGRAASHGRKASQMSTPSRQASRSEPSQPVATDVKEIQNQVRRGAATSLVKMFIDRTKEAIKNGQFNSPSGSTPQDVATQLGIRVEHALYFIQSGGSGEPNDAYKNHLRTITFNVKKNNVLALRLLNGELSPHGLASMDPKDMASEEQQRKDAAIIKEMEKQHTIIEEQGPRIRRTHKGEEYVDESQQVAAESLTSNAPARKPSMAETDGEVKSPTATSPREPIGRHGRTPSVSQPTRPKPSIDTKRQSSANFDIDKVWSNVQGSPDGEQRFGEMPQQSPGVPIREPAGPGAKADADIDELLKDEEAESPPYSPKDSADNDGIVWRGVINGGNLGKFHAAARYAAGATPDSPTLRMTYHQLIPAEIAIGGRIQPSKADEYLCGLEYSNTSDLVIVYVPEPQNSNESAEFDKLFKYFKSKDRFGVGVQHENPAIKDIYLIPLDAGQSLPTFVKKLETEFADPTSERMLLVPIVIKNSELPHNAGIDGGSIMSPTAGQVAQTPITPYDGNRDSHPPNGGAVPYHQPPPTQFQNGAPTQPIGQLPAGHPSAPVQSPPNSAAAAAQRVLGPHATSPAVLQLIQQAPNAGDVEMGVIKECIAENPEAAQSLEVLTNMLQARWAQ